MARHQKRVLERDAVTTTAAAATGGLGIYSATMGGARRRGAVHVKDVDVVVNVASVALSPIRGGRYPQPPCCRGGGRCDRVPLQDLLLMPGHGIGVTIAIAISIAIAYSVII